MRNSEIYRQRIFLPSSSSLTRAQLIDVLERILCGLEKQDVLLDLSATEVDMEMRESITAFHLLEQASARLAGTDQRRTILFQGTLSSYQARIRGIQAGIYEARYHVEGPVYAVAQPAQQLASPHSSVGVVDEDMEQQANEAEQMPLSNEVMDMALAAVLPVLVEPLVQPQMAVEPALAVGGIDEMQAVLEAGVQDVALGLEMLNMADEENVGAAANVPEVPVADEFIDRELARRREERIGRQLPSPAASVAEMPVQPEIVAAPAAQPIVHYAFPRCQHCGVNGHHIVRCPEFLDMGVVERTRRVDALRLCRNCFRRHGENCWFAGCHYCKTKHNSLLCPRREQI